MKFTTLKKCFLPLAVAGTILFSGSSVFGRKLRNSQYYRRGYIIACENCLYFYCRYYWCFGGYGRLCRQKVWLVGKNYFPGWRTLPYRSWNNYRHNRNCSCWRNVRLSDYWEKVYETIKNWDFAQVRFYGLVHFAFGSFVIVFLYIKDIKNLSIVYSLWNEEGNWEKALT